MMSWSDEPQTFGKSGSMNRAGSLNKSTTPGSPGARRSVELNNAVSARRGSLDHPVGSPCSPKHSPLVKEGQRFDGWSRFVDNGHLNVVEPAPAETAAVPVATEPMKQQVGGFDSVSQGPTAPSADPVSSSPSAGGSTPAAASEGDGKGWWKKMDQGVLNMPHEEHAGRKVGGSFTPQFNITGQSRDLDWGNTGADK